MPEEPDEVARMMKLPPLLCGMAFRSGASREIHGEDLA
jgi:hypothetical protein